MCGTQYIDFDNNLVLIKSKYEEYKTEQQPQISIMWGRQGEYKYNLLLESTEDIKYAFGT